ncbi:hypothetical protein JOM56_011700 [Amanita muscaria]
MSTRNYWKANAFLTAWYPTITRVRPRKGGKGKEVDVGNNVDIDLTEPTSLPIKRAGIPDESAPAVPFKKAKTGEISTAADLHAPALMKPMTMDGIHGMPPIADPLAQKVKPKPKPKTRVPLVSASSVANATVNPSGIDNINYMPPSLAPNAPRAPSPALDAVLSPIQSRAPSLAHNAPRAPSPTPNAVLSPIQSRLGAPSLAPNTPQAPSIRALTPNSMPAVHLTASQAPNQTANIAQAPSDSPEASSPTLPVAHHPPQACSNVPPAPSLSQVSTRPIVMPKATANYINNQFKFPPPVAHSFDQDIPGPSENEPFTQDPPTGSSNDNVNKSLQKENIDPMAPIAAPKRTRKGKLSTKQAVADDSITPKNLFKKHWLTLPEHTLESEFIKAWTSLQPEEKKLWKDQSMELKISFYTGSLSDRLMRTLQCSVEEVQIAKRGAERGGGGEWGAE